MARESRPETRWTSGELPLVALTVALGAFLPFDAAGEDERLPEELFSADGRTRAGAIEQIVEREQLSALPKVAQMAREDPGPGVRKFACWALGKLAGREALRTLRWVATNDTSPKVRAQAKRAVAAIERRSPPPAAAEEPAGPEPDCRNDGDCGREAICDAGACVPLVADARPGAEDAALATTGYALEAGVIGILGSATVLGLSIGAGYRKEDLLPAIPIAVGATLITVVAAPAIKSGSKSARSTPGVDGALGLRVIGWIAFGIHVGGSLALAAAIPFYWINADDDGEGWTPQRSWIIANGSMGAVALLCLAIDALVARSEALEVIERIERDERRERRARSQARLELRPFLAPTGGRDGASGAVAGLVAVF